MTKIGIGIIGGGYMGKAHSVAYSAVRATFETALKPRLVSIAASTPQNAKRYAQSFGFARAAPNWQAVVEDPEVEAVVIASPQSTHRAIAEAAFSLGKPVFCEKPLGATLEDARAMAAAAQASGCVNMIGFNYIRTPVTQYARKLVAEGALGKILYFRGEHTEDFYGDPTAPATWRAHGRENGTMGDLAPHMINAARALIGPIDSLMAQIETVYPTRGGKPVTNDDQAQMMVRFEGGASGHLFFSRVAVGRKMGYAYEIHGEKGALRFDQEDQNALWFYEADGPEASRGFKKILGGPAHPDYAAFCQGPGHGTGYQDQIIIEAKEFLEAIQEGKTRWPGFQEGLEVHRTIAAAWTSHETQSWQKPSDH